MESYRLLIKASAAKELERVGQKADRRRLVARIESLATDPRPAGCEKLSGAEDKYRVRQGSHRVVYAIDDEARTITIFKVGHRRDVYR
ncbi:type II toxin-antitoxin system RelE/ParE family toxin [bacterium]|nr:type II toxin-antitoxin system RelE/ParE family toxin [bacterium]